MQDDQDREFDAKFECHPGGYIVFTRRGGALFSVEERDAYIAAHRKAKPVAWKIFLWTAIGIIAIALVEFVLINAALGIWPPSPLRSNVIIASVLVAPAGLFVGLFVAGVLPVIRLIHRVNLDADRRPIVAPPRKRRPWPERLTNLAAFLGILGFLGAMIAGLVSFTWPWILAGCAVAALVFVAPGATHRNAKSPLDRQ